MKRHGNLYDKIIEYSNIELAFDRAKKGKSKYQEVQRILNNPEKYLSHIQNILIDQTFNTSPYKIKTIYEPKEREIFVLPFFPDRIVQHCIMNILEPIWDKLFIFDSYACRKNKGQHKASKRLMQFIRKSKYPFYFQGDIKKFYPSINHTILKQIISQKIKDKKCISLLNNIIDSISGNKNIPIGNYTSQWLGNLYLNELDQYIKHNLKCKYYLRYNDDFVILGKSYSDLYSIQESIRKFLINKLDLILAKEKIQPIKNGITFIGYRHFRNKILLRKSSKIRMLKNLKKKRFLFIKDKIKKSSIISTIASSQGWIKYSTDKRVKYKFQKYKRFLKRIQTL